MTSQDNMPMTRAEKRQLKRMKRFDNPWRNPKRIWGAGLLLSIVALGILGRIFWDTDMVFTGSGLPRQAQHCAARTTVPMWRAKPCKRGN